MNKKNIIFALAAAIFIFAASAEAAVKTSGGMYIVDDARGQAAIVNGKKTAAREEARRAAYRDALEKALGACVTGITEMKDFAVVRDKVFSKASGIVKDFQVISEKIEDDVLTLTGVCKVEERALDGVLGPDVIASLGNPRIMILIDEMVGENAPFISAAESETAEIFERAGYLLVDSDQAKALLHLDPSAAFDDPVKLSEAARTLKADIIVVGRAYAAPFAEQKVQGIKLYGVKGTVRLKSVLTQTAYQISSKSVERSTGKKPAQSVETGAERTIKEAAAVAAEEIVYKIAYSMASAGSAIGGTTVNIKIADASFQDVEAIEEQLREIAGDSGEIFERSYRDSLLEIDVVSGKTARELASFLSNSGIRVEALTSQTISGKIARAAAERSHMPVPVAVVDVHIAGVRSYDEGKIIEDALRDLVGASGETTGEYDGAAGEMKISLAFFSDPQSARSIASFVNRQNADALDPEFAGLKQHRVLALKVTGMTESSVECELSRGIL